jgi:hypothetical protein
LKLCSDCVHNNFSLILIFFLIWNKFSILQKFDLLSAADRHLITEFALKLFENAKKQPLSDAHAFVFNDLLLITRPRQVQIQSSPPTMITKHRIAYRVPLSKAFIQQPDSNILEGI